MTSQKINKILARRGVSVIACFALGVLYSVPYLAEQLFACTYLALTGFFAVLFTGDRIKHLYRHCIAFFFGFYLVLYSFLSSLYPFESFNFTKGQAIFVIIAACILIPLYHSALHSAIMLLLKPVKSKALACCILPCVWMIAELVIASGTLAFPWGTVALSQTGFLPMVQTSGVFGGYFITYIIIGGCSMIAYAIVDRKKAFAISGASIMLLNLALGTAMYFSEPVSNGELTIAAVQGNVKMEEKWQTDMLTEITERYTALVRDAANLGADIVVMPESAIPLSFTSNNSLGKLYKRLASEEDISIVVGVMIKSEDTKTNSVVAINADGSISEPYDKRHPVPFGEYIPYSELLETLMPFLKSMNLSGMTLEAGENAVVLECMNADVGTLVCFDSIFPSLALDEVREGAEIMTIVTNDSWFKVSPGVSQHYRHAKLRAIECGRYFVQAANTGVSAIIDEKGNVISKGGVQTFECIAGKAELLSHRTVYSYIGDFVLYPASAAVAAAIIYSFIKTKRSKNKDDSQDRKALSEPMP